MKIVGDEFRRARVTSRICAEPLDAIFGRSGLNEFLDFDPVSNEVLPSIGVGLTKDRNVRKIQIERGRSAPATEPKQWCLGFDERAHCCNRGGATSDHCNTTICFLIDRHNFIYHVSNRVATKALS